MSPAAEAKTSSKPSIKSRVKVRNKKKPAPRPPCPGVALPLRKDHSALTPGEELSYDITVAGLYIGKVDIKVGQPQAFHGKKVVPLFGRARTASFASVFEKFVGRTMSMVDLETFRPSELRVQSVYGDDIRRETVRFDQKKNALATEYRYKKKRSTRHYGNRDGQLMDLLSTVHYARLLDISKGATACQEIYLDRRLWRMDAHVRGVETIDTIAGDKQAMALVVKLDRMPHKDFDPKRPRPWLKGVFYYAMNKERTLLAFDLENRFAKGKGVLTRWVTKSDRTDASWHF
jgi:hypothetical protein